MEAQVVDITGKKVKSITLPEEIYGLAMNEHVLHTACKAYRANRRQGTHMTKTKSLVSGGGKKPFKQKGTGNARQGSSRSPLQPGGGTAFGPQPRSYRQYVSQRVKQLALRVALSDKVRHGKLKIVSDFDLDKYSTKHVTALMGSLGAPKATFADERKDDFLLRSVRNIHGAAMVRASELNAENVLRYEHLILSENALATIAQRLGGDHASV